MKYISSYRRTGSIRLSTFSTRTRTTKVIVEIYRFLYTTLGINLMIFFYDLCS